MKFFRRIIYGILMRLPDIVSLHPITREEINQHKEHRDVSVLWADEI